MKQVEIYVKSILDDSLQPSLFFQAKGEEKRPLLVGLHTWSADRFNQINTMLPYAEKYNFHLLLPEFRGPNVETNPNCKKACGSEYAKQDIIDAIDYCIAQYSVDVENVFLLGASGGGHMEQLMAGYKPEYFKAIGAFVGISDLRKWSEENQDYHDDVYACCGESAEEMFKRSPMAYTEIIAKSNIKIFHGKYDSSVPVTHSITIFNTIMDKYPQASVYLDIFDGGHVIDMEQAMYWFLSQYKKTEKIRVTG